MNNPYQTLGVNISDSEETIKKVYQKLRFKHHPDHGGNAKKFDEIEKAWDYIKNNRSNSTRTKNPHTNQKRYQHYVTITISLKEAIYGSTFMHMGNIFNTPISVREGDVVRYSNNPAVDLYVTFIVKPEINWHRAGDNLYKKQKVSALTLLFGGKIVIKLLDGKKIKLKISPLTQPGAKFRIRGYGVFNKNNLKHGDLYVTVNVV